MNLFRKIKLFFSSIIGSGSKGEDVSVETRVFNPYIDSDAISSLSTASIEMENKFGIKSTGKCGICVKDVNINSFDEMKKNIEDFLAIASNEQRKEQISFSFESLLDEYNYLWFILKGRSIEDVVAGINAVGDTIHEKGFSRQLLGAVFEFTSGYSIGSKKINASDNHENLNNENRNVYIIYNYKTDNFYPFVPIGPLMEKGKRKRDNEMEFNIMREISEVVPFQKDYTKWYPIWNIPF